MISNKKLISNKELSEMYEKVISILKEKEYYKIELRLNNHDYADVWKKAFFFEIFSCPYNDEIAILDIYIPNSNLNKEFQDYFNEHMIYPKSDPKSDINSSEQSLESKVKANLL